LTFFELKNNEVISTVYTAYPTRSLQLDSSGVYSGGDYNCDGYRSRIDLYDSGIGTGTRQYFDINGNVLSQSFNAKIPVYLTFNHTLTSSEKNAVHRLRNIYFSAAFHKPENYSSSSLFESVSGTCHILSISNILIGSGIKPSSFSLGMVTDDGYGGLYSGSVLVGCIFYEYGMALFGKDTTQFSLVGEGATTLLNFSATINTPMNVYICNAPKSMLNFSLNPSYTRLSGTKYEITTEEPETFITTICLYDENFEMVGAAKVANPIHNDESTGVQFRLKLNF
jgi:hypothetical protein